MKLNLKISLNCDIGRVRTNNEDMILVSGETYRNCNETFSMQLQDNGRFVVAVADGMGGHNAGEIASELTLEYLDEFLKILPHDLSDNDFRNVMDAEITKMHNTINHYGMQHVGCNGLGSTLVALLTYENRIYIINAGDSRLYRFRNGILCQMTQDHSEQNRLNDITIASNMIYNCIGGGGGNAFVDIQEITSKVYENDTFLLCSDGLSDMLEDDEIENLLAKSDDANYLVESAKKAGGIDNISAVLITIKERY